jgi:hypothetical protein
MAHKQPASYFDAILIPLARPGLPHIADGRVVLAVVLVILLYALSACSAPQPTGATQTPLTSTPGSTAPVLPSPTPTDLAPRAILLAPPGADQAQVVALEATLAELAARDGLRFERIETLLVGDLTPDLRIVVALPPDPGLASLAAAAPGTQFLALGIPGLDPSGNLSVIRASGERPDRQGFLAGYLASVVTPDWRVGVIGLGDSPEGKAAINGFSNGVIFYCGLCRPAYPPFNVYPTSYELAGGAGLAEQQAAADALISQGVTTVYLAPSAADTALLEYLANSGINLIGSEPPPLSIQEHWIAAIRPDWAAAVQEAWSGLFKGQAVDIQALPVLITDVNDALFSPGRQQWVEQTRLSLNAGLIDTGIDLISGEKK